MFFNSVNNDKRETPLLLCGDIIKFTQSWASAKFCCFTLDMARLSLSSYIWRDIENLEREDQRRLLEWQLIYCFSDKRAGDHLSLSSYIWKDIENLGSDREMLFLKRQLKAREPIRQFADMRAGDHLVRKASPSGGSIKYEHHFLCIGFDCKQKPKIVHYYKTKKKEIFIQEMTLPHEDFIKNEKELQAKGREVERVVWPEELKRFPVKEVIRRALLRKGEKRYHLTRNNCESYVMSCMCGLNISLQVTSALFEAQELLNAPLEIASNLAISQVMSMLRIISLHPWRQIPLLLP